MKLFFSITISSMLFFQGCATVKGLFSKKADPDEAFFLANIEKLRNEYQDGDFEALKQLIRIYEDPTEQMETRIEAGLTLSNTHHPTALNAISDMVATTSAVDYTLLTASIEMLAKFREDPKASESMIKAMHTLEERTNTVHLTLIENLNRVRSKDQIRALLDLYHVAKSNMARTEKLLTQTMGALGDRQVIPVLTEIAKNPNIQIGTRNQAVEILGKKNPQDVAVAFAELLGDPNTNLEVRDFALNTMKGVKEENLVLSLLDTYNMGKREYYSLLKTMLEALGEFDDPEVKKSVIEIAISQDYPLNIRKKAVENLANFKDPTVIPKILPLLKNKHSYDLYDYIIDMIYALGQEKLYENEIRQLAFEAHFSRRSHE
ncbi:MAG: hypothetical protein HOG20_07020 [Candidatus Marinimicrobia bacterium]|nr:hypothetical protein [Candidatus Neomarinimicrobiota bacterium]